jgi:hypothetical protein
VLSLQVSSLLFIHSGLRVFLQFSFKYTLIAFSTHRTRFCHNFFVSLYSVYLFLFFSYFLYLYILIIFRNLHFCFLFTLHFIFTQVLCSTKHFFNLYLFFFSSVCFFVCSLPNYPSVWYFCSLFLLLLLLLMLKISHKGLWWTSDIFVPPEKSLSWETLQLFTIIRMDRHTQKKRKFVFWMLFFSVVLY